MSSTKRGKRLGGPDDFYVTPAWAVHRLLEAWTPPGGLWVEPGAGNGAIIRAVNEVRDDVRWRAYEKRRDGGDTIEQTGASIVMGDFLAHDEGEFIDVRVVIGNPPYAAAMAFIERAMKLFPRASIAYLLRLNFIASASRAKFMRETKPSVCVLPNRPSFTVNGKTDSPEYAWFIWDKNQLNRGALHVLDVTPKSVRLVTKPRARRKASATAANGTP